MTEGFTLLTGVQTVDGQSTPTVDTRFLTTPADHGLLAWTADPAMVAASQAPTTAGRLEFVKLRLPAAASVTNIVMAAITAGSTLTAGQCFAALFAADRTLIGQTADQSTAWGTSGVKVMALAGGPFSLAAGSYLVGFWYNGTTSPAWARVASLHATFVNTNLASPLLRVGSANTGLTATAPASMGVQTPQQVTWWAALS